MKGVGVVFLVVVTTVKTQSQEIGACFCWIALPSSLQNTNPTPLLDSSINASLVSKVSVYLSVPVCIVCTARHLWNINCSFLSWSGPHCSGPGGLLTCLQMLAHLHCAGRCPSVTCTWCFLVTDWLLMTFHVCPSLIASFVNEYLQAWVAGPLNDLNDPGDIIDYSLLVFPLSYCFHHLTHEINSVNV